METFKNIKECLFNDNGTTSLQEMLLIVLALGGGVSLMYLGTRIRLWYESSAVSEAIDMNSSGVNSCLDQVFKHGL